MKILFNLSPLPSLPDRKSQVGVEGGGGPVVLQGRYSLSRMGLHLREAREIPSCGVIFRQGDQTDPGQRSENVSWACQGTARLRKVQKGAQDRGKMRGARLTFNCKHVPFLNEIERLSMKRIFS